MIKIFKDALKVGLKLPESKRLEEEDKKYYPYFYPYHRVPLRIAMSSKIGLRGIIEKGRLIYLKVSCTINQLSISIILVALQGETLWVKM